MHPMNLKIGRCLIPQLLDRLKMTQLELAKRTGISEKTISAYCTGRARNMPLINALKISIVLQCEPGDLYELI